MAYRALSVAAAVAAVLWGLGASAAEVGTVKLIKDSALERLMPEEWDDLAIEETVFIEQWLRTLDDSALHVGFVDGTDLRLGARSEIFIDKYVFDPDRGKGEFIATVNKGIFRFITGKMAKQDYRIVTPTATIGVRGSDFIVLVNQVRGTVLQVLKGVATMKGCSELRPEDRVSCPGTPALQIVAGQTGGTVLNSLAIALNVPRPAYDHGLDDDGGLMRRLHFGSDYWDGPNPCNNPPICTAALGGTMSNSSMVR